MPEPYDPYRRRVYYDEDNEPPPRRAPQPRQGPSSPPPRDEEIIYERREETRSHSPGLMPIPILRGRYSDYLDGETNRVRRRPERRRSPSAKIFQGDEEQDRHEDAMVPLFMREKRPGQGPLIVKERQQLSTGRHTTEERDNSDRNIRVPPVVEQERFRDATVAPFQAVYNSSNARDVTIHVEFEVIEDLDEELEEFSRLTRMGNFREAKSFFNENLRTFINKPNLKSTTKYNRLY